MPSPSSLAALALWSADANLGLAPGRLALGVIQPSVSGMVHRTLTGRLVVGATARADALVWAPKSDLLNTTNLTVNHDLSLTGMGGPGVVLGGRQETHRLYLVAGPSWRTYQETLDNPDHDLHVTHHQRSLRLESMVVWVSHKTWESGRVRSVHFGVPIGEPLADIMPELHLSLGLSFPTREAP